MSPYPPRVNLLECTLRDGSYAVDFKFTAGDTGLLAGLLSRLGFEWIEVGHGMGLGASTAGKGSMPNSDPELIAAAKAAAGAARVGMFCIPGIAGLGHLDQAAAAGLDFVRVGMDAPVSEQAFDHLARARELGLTPMMNFMKTYAIGPAEFGRRAREAAAAGAEVVYLVDSTGSMTPQGVAAYLTEARERSEVALGFHGHDNLRLAVANSLAALAAGASFVDVTLHGLGRSAGNAAAEVMVALLEREGSAVGVDLFQLLDVVESHLAPLMAYRGHMDMTAVAMGYAQFHSGFLPATARAAREERADLKRLVAAVGRHDPLHLDPEFLAHSAHELAETAGAGASTSLISATAPELDPQRLAAPEEALAELVATLEVVAAKRGGLTTGLILRATAQPSPSALVAEWVGSDRHAVLGRLTFGGLERLGWALEQTASLGALILDAGLPAWAAGARDLVAQEAAGRPVHLADCAALEREHLLAALERAAQTAGRQALVVYGGELGLAREALRRGSFAQVFWLGRDHDAGADRGGVVCLDEAGDWQALNLGGSVIYAPRLPKDQARRRLERMLTPGGVILCSDPLARGQGQPLIHLDLHQAYIGLLERLQAAARLLSTPEGA